MESAKFLLTVGQCGINGFCVLMTAVTKSSGRRLARLRLRLALLERGWTHRHLAEAAGLAPGTVRNVASGTSTSAINRERIETALGIPIWSAPQTNSAPT